MLAEIMGMDAEETSLTVHLPNLTVSHLEYAIAYYDRYLGFSVVNRSEVEAEIALGELRLKLLRSAGSNFMPGFAHLFCAEIEEKYEQLVFRGAVIQDALGQDRSGFRQFSVEDRDKNLLFFVNRQPLVTQSTRRARPAWLSFLTLPKEEAGGRPASPEKMLNAVQRSAWALKPYDILDSESEPSFDSITTLAALVCGTNNAAVNLIDRDRQWTKSKRGLDEPSESLRQSLCVHVAASAQPLIIPDSRANLHWRKHPAVAELGVCFYAGMPLRARNGAGIGALCVFDTQPHDLTMIQRDALNALAVQVENLLEYRRCRVILRKLLDRRRRQLARSELSQGASGSSAGPRLS